MDEFKLTEAEIEVLEKLGEAVNLFAQLEVIHPSDAPEFAQIMHAAQNIVLARSGMRQYQSHREFVYITNKALIDAFKDATGRS